MYHKPRKYYETFALSCCADGSETKIHRHSNDFVFNWPDRVTFFIPRFICLILKANSVYLYLYFVN